MDDHHSVSISKFYSMTIKDFLARLSSFVRLPPLGFRGMGPAFGEMHPKRWWPIVMGVAAVCLIATIAFNIGFFILSTRAIRSASSVGFDIAQVAVDRSQLADVVQLLDSRKAEFGRILTEPAPGDPSR